MRQTVSNATGEATTLKIPLQKFTIGNSSLPVIQFEIGHFPRSYLAAIEHEDFCDSSAHFNTTYVLSINGVTIDAASVLPLLRAGIKAQGADLQDASVNAQLRQFIGIVSETVDEVKFDGGRIIINHHDFADSSALGKVVRVAILADINSLTLGEINNRILDEIMRTEVD